MISRFGFTDADRSGVKIIQQPLEKHLAGKHDQSTHGGWADPSIRRMNAEYRLTAKEILQNQRGQGDSQKRKVYDAEERYSPEIVRNLPEPIAPKKADFLDDDGSYQTAWKKYSKDWDAWDRETSRLLVSDTAKEFLTGGARGVEKYFNAVTRLPEFRERFGSENPYDGWMNFVVADMNNGGQVSLGVKNGRPYGLFKMNKGLSTNEPTVLHELAHYATAISTPKSFEGHGPEYAGNYVFLTRLMMGDQEANRLQSEYEKEGVKIAN